MINVQKSGRRIVVGNERTPQKMFYTLIYIVLCLYKNCLGIVVQIYKRPNGFSTVLARQCSETNET